MRYFLSIFLLCLLCKPSSAQENKPEQQPQPRLEMGIRGQQPPGKNVLFLVDTSGSMDGRKVQDAIKTVMRIAEAPLDDLQIAIVNFGSRTHRWPGTRDTDPQNGQVISRNRWSLMPSRDNLRLALTWMHKNKDGGGTNVVSAVNHAFQSCAGGKGNETVRDLSIIIISDGLFSYYGRLERAIQEGQRVRRRNQMNEAAIGFFGIDDQDNKYHIKRLVGKETKQGNRSVWTADKCILGYFRLVYPEPEPEEADLLPLPQKKKTTPKPSAKKTKKTKKTKVKKVITPAKKVKKPKKVKAP